MDSPTHVVVLTPSGRGAVATLVVEGPVAVRAVDGNFHPADRARKLSDFPLRRIVFGRWGDACGEEIVACRFGDEQIELHCHGGRLAAERIQRDLIQQGCQAVEWPDWLLERSESAGEGLLEAEARIALAAAKTQRTAGILLDQLHGALSREIDSIRDLAARNAAEARVRLQALLDRAPLGPHLTSPWRIVLAGRPNVGKSSLINALLGYARAIVFDQPGTTRDVVTAPTAIDGWPVELSDTAGLRTSADELEAAGVARARRQIESAHLLLLVFDASQPWSNEDAALAAEWPEALLVFNKCDLEFAAQAARPAGLPTSALTRQGLDELLEAISRRLVPHPPPPGSPVPFTQRQVHLLSPSTA